MVSLLLPSGMSKFEGVIEMYENIYNTARLLLAALFAFTILLPQAHADYLKATVSPQGVRTLAGLRYL